MDVNDWTTILGSAVLAAVVSAWVARVNVERKIYVDNITKERAKWRERIRRISSEYPGAIKDKKVNLEIELTSRLNPYDPEDLKLLESLRAVSNDNKQELAVRVALLLKHDWERAKNEAKPIVRRRINSVKRLTYEDYMAQHHKYRNGDEKGFIRGIKRLTKDEPWT